MPFFADAEQCVLAVMLIAACGLFLGAMQTLSNWRLFRDDGFLSWDLIKTQSRFRGRAAAPLFDRVFRFPNFLCLLAVQAAAALSLLALPRHPGLRPAALCIIFTVGVLQRVRNQPHGLQASDTLNLMVFGALCLREIDPGDALVTRGCLWFIALQSCLSYAANGVLKLQTPHWRRGTVLRAIAHHPFYGNARLAALLDRRPRLAALLDWSVIGYEMAFPIVLVTGHPWSWIFLGSGVVFHALIASTMGLNTFFFAWVATYPAVAWVAFHARASLLF